MARTSKTDNPANVIDYRHDDKRTNIPTSSLAGQGTIPPVAKMKYYYNPHLSPVLRFDPSGKADRIQELIVKAGHEPLTDAEQKLLAEALNHQQPWLEWTGKLEAEEKGFFEVDPVALHIHERVSTQAILRSAKREDVQKDLFADPQEDWRDLVKWYQHDVDWTNRLILGDSLQVMTSLATRENLAGQVQMIYMDPPYGIKYASNFQSQISKKEVKDKDADFSREPEMVRAYRDTWELGIHSYLKYLKDRITVARNLLNNSGSLFLQIGEENLHRVRSILDEVFGANNLITVIAFRKTGGQSSNYLSSVADYLLWYAKDQSQLKFRQIFRSKTGNERPSIYRMVQDTRTGEEKLIAGDDSLIADKNFEIFAPDNLTSLGATPSGTQPYSFNGKTFHPGLTQHWKTTTSGITRLSKAERLVNVSTTLYYKRFLNDFPVIIFDNLWQDTSAGGYSDDKLYAVQTNRKVIERCMFMTTDPGDLVLDPTCGSGTTAYVAEQWGRRWITIDTSRVAASIARQRIMTSRFLIYKGKNAGDGRIYDPAQGFEYKTVPHITLKSIAQNTNLDPLFAKHEPVLDAALGRCNQALQGVTSDLKRLLETKLLKKQKAEGKSAITDADERRWKLKPSWEHWEVPFDTDSEWPATLQSGVTEYRKAWRAKMDEINKCIADNADQEALVDDPVVLPGVRVSGPFTVEGVMPLENYDIPDDPDMDVHEEPIDVSRNAEAYLTEMIRLLRNDGVTFPGNKVRKFKKLEPLWSSNQDLPYHAEGWWEDSDENAPAPVAIAFGPQYGPLNVKELEEMLPRVVRGGMSELVLAAFNFDPETLGIIEDSGSHPKLMIHKAFIRPDVNPGMAGLLKDTPRSQLFTVFGKPEIDVRTTAKGEIEVELLGVDIYDPLTGSLLPTKADKVAAWFLDSDYDNRCFCITQAFFPDQDAWEKISKALKTQADQYAFAAYKGTISIPFIPGQHRRIAVKVIDPRGNEVMVVKKLEGK